MNKVNFEDIASGPYVARGDDASQVLKNLCSECLKKGCNITKPNSRIRVLACFSLLANKAKSCSFIVSGKFNLRPAVISVSCKETGNIISNKF